MKTRITTLEFFQDDANGEYGVAHQNSIRCETPFNAFWNGIGIFHDIFEHYFEDVHPYFTGRYSFNVAGEMAALGHAIFYYENIGRIRLLNPNSMWGFETGALKETLDMAIERVTSDGYTYGHTFECRVPKQKPVYHGYSSFEAEMPYTFAEFKKCVPGSDFYEEDEQRLQECKEYKRQLTFSKYASLYRWGYKQAMKIYSGNENFNFNVLTEFIEFWNMLTKNCQAEEMMNIGFNRIEFKISKVKGELRWAATFKNSAGSAYDVKFKSTKLPKRVDLEDFYVEEEYY